MKSLNLFTKSLLILLGVFGGTTLTLAFCAAAAIDEDLTREFRSKGKAIADSIAVSHQIQIEDLTICEEVQRGLASRSYSTGRFSVRREAAGYHFHRLLARSLQAEARREAETCAGGNCGQA